MPDNSPQTFTYTLSSDSEEAGWAFFNNRARFSYEEWIARRRAERDPGNWIDILDPRTGDTAAQIRATPKRRHR